MSPFAFRARRTAMLAVAFVQVMLGLGFALQATKAHAAPKPSAGRLTASLSADRVWTGTSVALTGKVRPAGSRTVQLQVRRGTTWKPVLSIRTARTTGAYRLTVPTATAGMVVIRAHAPKRGRTKAISSPSRTLHVTAPPTPPCCKPIGSAPPSASPAPVPTPVPVPTVPVVVTTPPSANPSFRAIHALASDAAADPQQVAAITASVRATNDWFKTQTIGGVQPRWVRDAGGAVVVSTVRLPRPASAYDAATFASVVKELEAAAPTPAGQRTVVWFDVGSPNGCGVTGSGFSVLFEAACDIHPTVPSPTYPLGDVFPYGASYLTAHEMTHLFGAVAMCAPHASGGGHVNDDPRDVLYAGNQPRAWDQLTLDPGHDDYYDTGVPACPGIESSPLWTTTGDPLS